MADAREATDTGLSSGGGEWGWNSDSDACGSLVNLLLGDVIDPNDALDAAVVIDRLSASDAGDEIEVELLAAAETEELIRRDCSVVSRIGQLRLL